MNERKPITYCRRLPGFSEIVGRLMGVSDERLGEHQSLPEEGESTGGASHETSRCLLVGLGNPGREYGNNRHNIGFMIVDNLASEAGISLDRIHKRARVGSGQIGGRSVILAKPQTYVNLSGDSVGPLAEYYRIPPGNVLVVYDELDLPLGTIRLREKGGAGGHNGVRSIIRHLGQDFPRMRIGIGRPPGQMPPAAYVLQDFRNEEAELLTELIAEARSAIETFLQEGIEMAMSRHNGPVRRPS